MEKIFFYKMSGAGNDFILIDKNLNPDFSLDSKSIKRLCDRRNGIGADGVITIANSNTYDFDMQYYNADGSTGSLCGNGARCAIKFAGVSGRIKNGNTSFLSNGQLYSGEILNGDEIKFFFNSPRRLKTNFIISAGKQMINSSFVDTGSPHVVINIEDIFKDAGDPESKYNNLDDVPVLEIGREIRYHKDFEPGGTNVNFIKLVDNNLHIRTYERGVEDETLACGTGATASAIIGHSLFGIKPPIKLITRGGDELVVDYELENHSVKNLSLTGPAKVTFTGELLLNQYF